MCKLRLHIIKNYKSERHCHRVTKKGLKPIFTPHKMNQRNNILKSRHFSIKVKLICQSGGC